MSGRQETIEKEISDEEEREEQASSSGSSPLAKKSREKTSTRERQQSSTTRKPSKKIEGREVEKKETGKEEAKSSSEETSIYAKGPSMNNYPGSPKKVDIKKMMSNEKAAHFKVDFGGHSSRQKCGWFMFRVDNAGGKKVRIDLTNIGRYDKWKTLNPVYAEIPNISDPKYFVSKKPKNGYEYVEARNGPKIPKTKGLQHWHYITNVETKDTSKTLTLRQKFTKNRVYIAMRPPYTLGLHENYMKMLKQNREVKVHTVGESAEGRPLHVVEVENPTDPEAQKDPVVVYSAGEHPDEMDAHWSADGVLRSLLSNAPEARSLRRKATFLIIPVLDPDGLARSQYENITYSFSSSSSFADGSPTPASISYSRWFRKWANQGRRLTTICTVHNVESGETKTHLFSYLMEPKESRNEESMRLWKQVSKRVKKHGYRVGGNSNTGYTPNRLGGFLKMNFRTLQLFVELNSQARPPSRKLTLHELRGLGKQILTGMINHLFSGEAKPLLRDIRAKRKKRQVLVKRYEDFLSTWNQVDNPFERETWLWGLPMYERHYKNNQDQKNLWERRALKDLYEKERVSLNNIPSIK